jgi:Flp pilus assembly protein TadD
MLDEFGHHFMPYHPPRMPGVEPRDAALYSEVMTSAYRFQDMMLESLLARAGSETTVILVSDHGFHLGDRRPSANGWDSPQEWHREFGIACAAGPGVRSDQTLYGASLLDVTPTILALLGLPVGEDMDGRAWLEILDPSPRLERIESWEQVPDTSPTSLPAAAVDPTAEAEMIRQLVNLGYLDPPSADAQQSVRDAIRDAKVNLAVAVTSSRRAAEALHLWKELIRDHPDEEGFRLQLAHCYMRLGKWPECFEEIELLSQELRESGLVKLMLATVAAGEGRLENALDQARNLARLPMHDPGLVNRLGSLFIQLRAWTEADTEFRRSLELMPDNPVARDGLSQICFHRHEFDVAAEHALEAVGLMHFFPGAHFHLAEALSASGRDREAILAFEASLSMGYEPAATHRRLADMYRIRDPAKSLFHHGLAADAGAWTLTADEC